MNIRLRMTVWYTVILTIILLTFSAVVYLGLSRSLLRALDNHLQREAALAIGNIHFVDQDTVEMRYRPDIFWRLLTPQGEPLIDPGYFIITTAPTTTDRSYFEFVTLADNHPVRLYNVSFIIEGHGAGILQVGESYTHVRNVEQQLIFMLSVTIPITILLASVGGWFLASNALTPIDRITRAAQEISARDLHQRLNLDLPNDEVGRLARTFDQMLARLDNAFEQQKRFIADASHEMRTPLTILKGDVEVALIRPRAVAEYQKTLALVNDTTDRLTNLVEELLLLARADNKQAVLQLEAADLGHLLQDMVSQWQVHAKRKGITLSLEAPSSVILPIDESKLLRLFINLIDNALKYSEAGDTVQVVVQSQTEQVQVTVCDTGPGIPPEHLPHLFSRFYRVDKARSQAASQISSGSGLGLSIAQRIAELHGGSIVVESALGQGTTFTVLLPRRYHGD